MSSWSLNSVNEVLNALEKLGDPRVRAMNARNGAPENQLRRVSSQ